MSKIPMLEKFAAQSLVYADTGLDDGKELIFSKEKFAELIVKECIAEIDLGIVTDPSSRRPEIVSVLTRRLQKHFGVEE